MFKLSSNSSRLQLACAAIASLAFSQGANAAFTALASDNGGALPNTARLTFDSLPAGNIGGNAGAGVTVAFTPNGETRIGTSSVAAAPFFNNAANDAGFGNAAGNQADPTQYLSTGSYGAVTLTFATPQSYLGLHWGSADNYNKLELYITGNPNPVATFIPGTNVPDKNGNQGLGGSFYVNISGGAGDVFDKVVATSGGVYAFEFDNVAIVPEPSTYVAGGLALLPLLFGLRSRFMKK